MDRLEGKYSFKQQSPETAREASIQLQVAETEETTPSPFTEEGRAANRG